MNKLKFKFTPEMFDSSNWLQLIMDGSKAVLCVDAAAKANEALEAHLITLPTVFGKMYPRNDGSGMEHGTIWNVTPLQDHTVHAVLFNLEPVEQKVCNHKPGVRHVEGDVWLDPHCLKCGAKLKANWTVADE